ncbi:MAG: hypothetical protein FWC32_12375 [Firmicutes bacterium]|nr:hypothetical protein [Bacillota bacterium]
MNKILMCLLGGVIIFLLAACGSDNDTVNTNTTINHVDESPTENPTAEEALGNSEEFDFFFRETVISLNQNMAEVLDVLGEPIGIRQTPSCAFEGYDRIFGFGAINIHTYPIGDDDFIQVINFRDDSVTTRNGIRLGDSWNKVVDTYGSDYEQDFNIRTFTRGRTMLSFFVENDIVVEITYSLIMN